MKKITNIVGALAIAAALTAGFTACTNEDNLLEEQQPTVQAPVYHVSIPANFGGAETRAVTFGETTASSTFATTDSVFVYNETKNAWAHNRTKFLHLQPTNLADGGKSCTLSGDLTFCSYTPGHYVNSDYVKPAWTSVTVEAGDTYKLYYKAISGNGLMFYYDWQNGTQNEDHPAGDDDSDYSVSRYDFALAEGVTMTLNDNTLTLDGHVRFTNYGSMFRRRLSFSKEGSPMTLATTGLRYLYITTEHKIFIDRDKLFDRYDGGREVRTDNVMILVGHPSVMDANGDVYFALAFDNTNFEVGDKLTFMAEDYNGNLYKGEKPLPPGGLQNGKYYYGTLEMEWQSQRAVPTVTASDASPILPDNIHNCFHIGNGATISGNSDGFFCYTEEEGTVTLTGNGMATGNDNDSFLIGEENLTVNLASDYTINFPNASFAISSWENLYLMTTGGPHTLTVTTYGSDDCGLYSYNTYNSLKNDHETITEVDVTSQLAAPGYTVTRSARVNGPDNDSDGEPDYYTWTYTVAPSPFTAAAVGKVIGADGVIYDDAATATTAGTTAEAMIAYVGAQPGVCANGLAISLTDIFDYNTTYAQTIGEWGVSYWASSHSIAGGSWRLPSFKDWQYMLWGYYAVAPETTDISGFNTKLTTAGGTALASGSAMSFWSSTESGENVKCLYYDGSKWSSFQDKAKTEDWRVRACFAF